MPLAFARKLVVMSMFPLPIAFGAESQLHHTHIDTYILYICIHKHNYTYIMKGAFEVSIKLLRFSSNLFHVFFKFPRERNRVFHPQLKELSHSGSTESCQEYVAALTGCVRDEWKVSLSDMN